MRLQNTVTIVSGAGGGLGQGFIEGILREGGRVVMTDVHETGGTLSSYEGEAAMYLPLDVTSEAAWTGVVQQTHERFGPVTGLINNAGVTTSRCYLEEETAEQFRKIVDVNLVGVHNGMRAVIPAFRANGGGSIINISSAAAMMGMAKTGAYAAAKWGVKGLTKVAAVELAEANIRVNSVHPGIIVTPMTSRLSMTSEPGGFPNNPARRAGTPEELSGLINFLLSDESRYLNGAAIPVDGGWTAGPTPEYTA